MKREYETIEPVDRERAISALSRNDPQELVRTVLAVALHESELAWAQDYCFRLADHSHSNVRGSAILGLGHIARIHRFLDLERAEPVIKAGLKDSNESVRRHARSAAEDIKSFLGQNLRDAR